MKKYKDPRGRKPDVVRAAKMKALRDLGWTWERIGRRFKITRMGASQAVKRHFPET
jgi:hypothetical protein